MGVCLEKLYIYTVICSSSPVAAVCTNRSYPKWLEIALEVRYLHARCKQFGIILHNYNTMWVGLKIHADVKLRYRPTII